MYTFVFSQKFLNIHCTHLNSLSIIVTVLVINTDVNCLCSHIFHRIDNIYYSSAAQITDLSSTDGVYSKLDREETTTEIPHHLNTPALPTYSSLADVQQNTSNIEDLPLNYDMVRLENVSGSKTGVVDPCSSLAEDIQKSTSTVKELPQNYDMVRLENISETKTSGVIDQDSAEVIRVQPAAVYSTVVRQNGKKMTVKLDIYP